MSEHGDNFYIYLISNASSDLYPDNTLTQFSNHLDHSINLGGDWMVCLQSIYISLNWMNEKEESGIRVICPQIQSHFGTLSVHAVRTSSNDSHHSFEPIIRNYFPLEGSMFNHFDIKVTNMRGQRIQLSNGQSTVVVLNFKKRPLNSKTHSVQISNLPVSRASWENVDNPSSFTSIMPPELSPVHSLHNASWEMALSSITYENRMMKWNNITQCSIWVAKSGSIKEPGAGEIKQYNMTMAVQLDMNILKAMKNDKSLLTYIVKSLKAVFRDICAVKVVYVNGYITIECAKSVYLHLTSELAYILGWNQEDLKPSLNPSEETTSSYIFLEQNIQHKLPRKFDSQFFIPKAFLVYTNCIRPSLIGSTYAPILKSIPIRRSSSKAVTYESKNLEYKDIIFSALEHIRFDIVKADGEHVKFEEDKGDIFLTLMFRQKRS